MKIDYKNYPVLKYLEKGHFDNLIFHNEDDFYFKSHKNDFLKNFFLFKDDFNLEINVISNPFLDASMSQSKKLLPITKDFLNSESENDFFIKGTFIIKSCVYMISYNTNKKNKGEEFCFYSFDKFGKPLFAFTISEKHNINQSIWVSDYFKEDMPKHGGELNYVMDNLLLISILKIFKSYAQVETKILHPNQRVKDIVCRYKNDTKLKLTFLDSKWFTNLVKSDGFNVRGHFRLQPKKVDGKMSKELIWISEFQKTGYTSPARMLSVND